MSVLSRHIIRDHVLAGGIIALIAMHFWGFIPGALFWLASIFIDTDHWFCFLCQARFRFWDPFSMMRFYEALFDQKNSKEFLNIDIYHTAEFVCLLGGYGLRGGTSTRTYFLGRYVPSFRGWDPSNAPRRFAQALLQPVGICYAAEAIGRSGIRSRSCFPSCPRNSQPLNIEQDSLHDEP